MQGLLICQCSPAEITSQFRTLCNALQAADVAGRLGRFELATEPSMAAEDFSFLAGAHGFAAALRADTSAACSVNNGLDMCLWEASDFAWCVHGCARPSSMSA
jgi:hypothetical protein